jgi:molecular chaperone DnaJ
VPDAVLGTSLDVPTLDGPVSVTVPAGTQPETVLRLRGKGLPQFESQRHGDLYLLLQVRVPESVTPKTRQLYESLRSLEREPRSIK